MLIDDRVSCLDFALFFMHDVLDDLEHGEDEAEHEKQWELVLDDDYKIVVSPRRIRISVGTSQATVHCTGAELGVY